MVMFSGICRQSELNSEIMIQDARPATHLLGGRVKLAKLWKTLPCDTKRAA
jgi:hypothetical protein